MIKYYLYKTKELLRSRIKVILSLSVVVTIIVIAFCTFRFTFTKNVLMAHGLGGVEVDGKVYDINNTYEGFERSYKTGIRNFEVDLMLSNDEKVVAFHPYSQALYNRLKITNLDFSYEEFMSGKYFIGTNLEGLKPLDVDDIVLLISEYKDTKWVIHIHSMNSKEYTEIFLNAITNSRYIDDENLKRISIGINYQEELNILKKYNIQNLIYTFYEKEKRDDEVDTDEKLLVYLIENKIKCVSMNKSLVKIYKNLIKRLKYNDINVMCYAENDFINQIKLKLIGMDYIETDNFK